jgi:hypothetical protein
MNSALARVTLRWLAVAIAIAALIDPVFSNGTAMPPPVVAIHLTSSDPDAIDRALRDNVKGRELITRTASGHRLPCATDEDCVVIADGSIDVDWTPGDGRSISLITTPPAGEPNVRVRSVSMSSGHRSAAGVARVELSGRAVEGKRTEVRILDGAAVIGSATHQWAAALTATIDVPWWPVDLGARVLRVEAIPVDGEVTAIDNHLDAGVTIAGGRSPILVFDARPSWNSTFVRRSLEDDPRFAVEYRSQIAPGLSISLSRRSEAARRRTNGRLDAAALDAVPLVIVGGPDALNADDAALLDRYVRVRGGTLVLLPEQRLSGPAASLIHGVWTEHLTANPEAIGPLRAGEILRAADAAVTSTVIARSGSSPAIVSTPSGNGRIIVSGAIDAWRYRDLDNGAFDRFWRSLVVQGAAAGEALTLTFDRSIAATGSRARFTLRDRSLEQRSSLEASAVSRCNDGPAAPARVWPTGTIGEFTGELPAASRGHCTVEATVDDRQVSGAIAIADRPARGIDVTLARLETLVRGSGGAIARAGDEAAIMRTLAAATPPVSHLVPVHPMRRPWWILPFAGCVSAEWWLRRRRGLR